MCKLRLARRAALCVIVFAGPSTARTATNSSESLRTSSGAPRRRAAASSAAAMRTRLGRSPRVFATRSVPPEAVVELESHEAAALMLSAMTADAESPELERFVIDYIAENEWTRRPLSGISNAARRVESLLALQIGRWFFDEGLQTPIGGLDENGEDLPPREIDFAALAGANAAFADVASAWARFDGMLAELGLRVDEMLRWLRSEREQASAMADADDVDELERARAGGRVWALREAGLWLEAAANRSRAPWDPPRHEA